jgi:hypothetical protein
MICYDEGTGWWNGFEASDEAGLLQNLCPEIGERHFVSTVATRMISAEPPPRPNVQRVGRTLICETSRSKTARISGSAPAAV